MKWLSLALSLLPGILQAVVAVEAVMAGANGQTKKQTVMAAIGAAAQAGETIPEDHVKLVSSLIDSVVGQLNASGVFNHAATPAA